STPLATLSNQGIFTLPTTPICGGLLAAKAPRRGSALVAPKAAAPCRIVRREVLRISPSSRGRGTLRPDCCLADPTKWTDHFSFPIVPDKSQGIAWFQHGV